MCVAGAKIVAVGWGADDSLGNHGTLCGATIRTIYGRQLYRESIRGLVRSDQDEGTNEMRRAERSEG